MRKLVNMRLLLISTGRGHVNAQEARMACDRLLSWLRYNPTPSGTTLRALWRGPLGDDLRRVAVRNRSGYTLLDRFAFLTQHII